MPQFDSLIGFLDSRSFGTIWYWLVVLGVWSSVGRSVIGVPSEIIGRAANALQAGDTESPVVLHLLDWLSLVLPRWRLPIREGAAFLGASTFLLSSLAIMGLVYELELALASVLLLAPLALLFWLRVALARQLMPLLMSAEQANAPIPEVASKVVRRMIVHRRIVTLLSMFSVAVTAISGALWAALHPFGF